MDTLLAVLAVLAFTSCVTVMLVVRAVQAVRRRARELGERIGVTARAYAGGPAAEVARLRRELDRSVAGARRALHAARAVDAPVGDVPALLVRLELAARAVDGELRMLDGQRDPARVSAQLAGPRSRAQAVIESAAALVDGLLAAAGHSADDLAVLQAECAIEADALRAARRAGRSPLGR
jgi:hypothetical protein